MSELTPEEQEALNTKFFENPTEAVTELAKQIAKGMIETDRAEREAKIKATVEDKAKWSKITNEFTKNHPDHAEYKDDMVKFINDPAYKLQGDEKGFEKAYALAKAQRVDKVPTIDDMLKSDEAKEKILANEEIVSQIVQSYLDGIRTGKTKPKTITSNKKSQPPTSKQAKKATNLDDATDNFLASIGG